MYVISRLPESFLKSVDQLADFEGFIINNSSFCLFLSVIIKYGYFILI
jgi:hypothetical protein